MEEGQDQIRQVMNASLVLHSGGFKQEDDVTYLPIYMTPLL